MVVCICVCVFGSERKWGLTFLISSILPARNRTAAWTRVPLPVTSVVLCVSEFPVLLETSEPQLLLSCVCAQCLTLCDPIVGYSSWNLPSKNTGAGCNSPTPGDLSLDWGRLRVHTCFSWVSLHAHFPHCTTWESLLYLSTMSQI